MSATKSINHQSTTTNPRSHAMTSTTSTPTNPEDPRASADRRRWKTLAVLCLSLLITVLDTTVVNVALPTLDRTLHASSSGLEWIVDAYTLVFAGLLMLGGALGDRYGRHRALPAGLLIFGAGSVIAASAGSVSQLIVARAVMGAGAALVMPATLSILTGVFTDPAERAKAIGIWSAVSGLGVAVGPTLGGLLLEHFAWSSIFLINIPVVVVALIAGRRLVPASRAPKAPRIDITGASLSVAGLSALTYTLIQAPSNGWTSSSTILTGVLAAWPARRLRHPADPPQRPADRSAPVREPAVLRRLRGRDGAVLRPHRRHVRADPDLPVRARLLTTGRRPARPGAGADGRDRGPDRSEDRRSTGTEAPDHDRAAAGDRWPVPVRHRQSERRVPALHDRDDVRRSRDRPVDGARDALDHELRPARQSRRRLRDQRHHPQPRRRPGRRDRRQRRRHQLQDRAHTGHHPPRADTSRRSSVNRSDSRPRSASTSQAASATRSSSAHTTPSCTPPTRAS